MKINKKINRLPIERELRALFKDIYADDELAEETVRDALTAYSYVKQDILYRKSNEQ